MHEKPFTLKGDINWNTISLDTATVKSFDTISYTDFFF